MTYNIRLDVQSDGEDRWDARKSFLADQLKFYSPDVLGTQEVLYHQLTYLDSSLEDWSFIGVGRDDGMQKGEYSAIFYNRKKVKMLENSTFWLSETPGNVSVGWDAALPRICTWGLFESRSSKQKFMVFNTHFDHVGKIARIKSAELIMAKLEEINTKKYPIMIMGDLNLEPSSEPIQKFSEKYIDSRNSDSPVKFGPEGTFNGFRFNQPKMPRIDYIFLDPYKISILKYAVLSDSRNSHYPSDHLPVFVEVEIQKKGKHYEKKRNGSH